MIENELISMDKMRAELHKMILRLQYSQETTRTRERELEKLRADNALLRVEIEQLKHRLDLRGCAMALHKIETAVRGIADDHSGDATEKAGPARLPTIGIEDC